VYKTNVGANGVWAVHADAKTAYEFIVGGAPGYAITHIYRSAFPRSSAVVHLRAERMVDADKSALAVVTLTAARYFGCARYREPGRTEPPPGVPQALRAFRPPRCASSMLSAARSSVCSTASASSAAHGRRPATR